MQQAMHPHKEETEKENKDPRFSCMKICGTVIVCRHSFWLFEFLHTKQTNWNLGSTGTSRE